VIVNVLKPSDGLEVKDEDLDGQRQCSASVDHGSSVH
jgi:hypothetical protein